MPPYDDLDRKIGDRIKSARKHRRMSLSKLAAELGLTYQQVQKYETGRNRVSASTLFRIAEALGVELSFLFGGCSSGGERSADASRSANRGDDELRTALLRIQDLEIRSRMVALLDALASKPGHLTKP